MNGGDPKDTMGLEKLAWRLLGARPAEDTGVLLGVCRKYAFLGELGVIFKPDL